MVERMSFLIKNDEVGEKFEEVWNVIKNKLNIKFYSEPVYENKYSKTKVREFDGNNKVNFLGNNLSKENTYYTCKVQKMHTSRFINTELETESESDVETDSGQTQQQ